MSQERPRFTAAWISYLNTLPIKIELQKRANINFLSGHPRTINALLAERKVDFGLTSSIAFFKNNPRRENFIPYGIGCLGPVQSVYFGFKNADRSLHWMIEQKSALASYFSTHLSNSSAANMFDFPGHIPPKEFSVQFTPASETSITLAKIFLRLFSGRNVLPDSQIEPQEKTEKVTVLIGDEALQKRDEFDSIIDLSSLWFEVTGLPFVFALWQIYGANDLPLIIAESCEAAKRGLLKNSIEYLPLLPFLSTSGQPVDLKNYWDCLDYKLTANHLRGLELFFDLYTAWAGEKTFTL